MKQLILVIFLATSLAAQTTYEIRGTVSEPGLGVIAGAEVTATNGNPGRESVTLTAFTDGRGQFVLRTTNPGAYRMTVQARGYANVSVFIPVAEVDADHLKAEGRYSMYRPAQATGRVLDAETREPVEGVLVSITPKVSGLNSAAAFGNPILTAFGDTPADMLESAKRRLEDRLSKADGAFTVSGISPGEYVASIFRDDAPMSAGFSADDLKTIDRRREALFWPGGVSFDEVRPISIGSGAVVSFGDILVKHVPGYRVHVTLAQGTCPEGESMRVSVFRSSSRINGTYSCGSELLLRGLTPGSYHLYAVSDWQGERDNVESAAWATTQFEISNKNIEVTLVPQRGVVLEGQLVAAEGVSELPERIGLAVQPEELAPGALPAAEEFIEWPARGRFRMAVAPRGVDLRAIMRTGAAYVKQLRYNGASLPDMHVPVNPGTPAHRLEIVLDDKFASVKGDISGGGPMVMVELWKEGLLKPVTVLAENGSFASGPLAPGEYRVLAVMPVVAFESKSDLKTGLKVTVHAGETATVKLVAK